MNFEFLKDLRGFEGLYDNCSNAEKLARTMPVQSIFTSRKSAELLAKFIYMAACNQRMEDMTFADILSDWTFKNFIRDRAVMDAFHSIRKQGNQAVHDEDNEETAKDAIDVLHDLHYVAGESACMLGLIKRYAKFESKIDRYPNAVYVDEKQIEKKALQMFNEYVKKYDAQAERDHYFAHRVDKLTADFTELSSLFRMVPGMVDLGETIEFKAKPKQPGTIKWIQEHFCFLGIQYIKYLQGELKEDRGMELSAELTIYGEDGYTTNDLYEYMHGILYDLPNAQEGFMIKSVYFGPSIAPYVNSDVKEEFYDTVTTFGQFESFEYSIHEFLYNHDEGWCARYRNGEWIDLKGQYSASVLDRDFGEEWWCQNLDISVEFDFEKHSDILEALRDAVRKHIPPEELSYCEDRWEDEPYILVNSISWTPRKLRAVQDFLDEINAILKPIMSECDGCGMGNWYIKHPPFAIATWDWTENGFVVAGTEV